MIGASEAPRKPRKGKSISSFLLWRKESWLPARWLRNGWNERKEEINEINWWLKWKTAGAAGGQRSAATTQSFIHTNQPPIQHKPKKFGFVDWFVELVEWIERKELCCCAIASIHWLFLISFHSHSMKTKQINSFQSLL